MKGLRIAVVSCLFLALAAVSQAGAQKDGEKKASNKEKIVGVWEVVKSKDAPKGATVEFTKDGKLIFKAKLDEKEVKFEGTYSVDGEKIETTIKLGDEVKKDTLKIKELTDKKLVTQDDKGDVDEFKKK